MNSEQKKRARDLQARLQAIGAVGINFFKGEKWNEAPIDKRLDEMEIFVKAAEEHCQQAPLSADAVGGE